MAKQKADKVEAGIDAVVQPAAVRVESETATVTDVIGGRLAAREADDAGTLELYGAALLADGDRVDVVWGGGIRRDVDAGSNDAGTLAIRGGEGVPLPGETTPVNVEITRAAK